MRLVTVLIFSLGGICAYLMILNRWIIHIRNGGTKLSLITAGFLVVVGGFVYTGYSTNNPWSLMVPIGILVLVLALEIKRHAIRRYSAGFNVKRVGDGGSQRPITTMELRVERFRVPCPVWDGRIRVAHISDLHVNTSIPMHYYERGMERIAREDPDMIFLTGDFVTHIRHASLLETLLGRLHAPLGCFAVLGNHDHWAGERDIQSVLESASVIRLGNGSFRLTTTTGSSIVLSGCEMPWSGGTWEYPAAEKSDLVIVLSHTPDNIYRISGNGVTAVFAGHYHAGQIRLPLLGTIVIPSIYGRRFDHGHFVVNGTHLFVSAGIGAAVPPVRLYSYPDIFIVDFEGQG